MKTQAFFNLNDCQKFSHLPPSQCAAALYEFLIVVRLLAGKLLKFYRFESVQNLVSYFGLKFILFRFVLNFFFAAKADVVLNLFLNFEQNEGSHKTVRIKKDFLAKS